MLLIPGRSPKRKMTRTFSTFHFVPCMLEVWGGPWSAKVGSQENARQDSAQPRSPSWGRALLVERRACWRWHLLSLPWGMGCNKLCHKIHMVGCPWVPKDGAIRGNKQLPIRPAKHPHGEEPAHNTHPRCVPEVSCSALWLGGKKRVKQELKPVSFWKAANSSKFTWLACNEMLCWQVCA